MSIFFMRILLFTAMFSNVLYAQNSLQYNLKVGDSMRVFQKVSQNIIQDMDGAKHELKNILEADYTFIVSHKTDSTYSINFNFDRFKMITTSNLYGEVVNIDTNNDISKDNLQGQVFLGMIGAKLKMELLKTGKVKSVLGTEKMITKMVANAGISDKLTKDVMIESMKKEFGNETLARSFEQMTFIYSNKKVNIGDTWTNNYKGKLNAINTWKLNKINEKSVELNGDSNVTMSSKNDDISMTLVGNQKTNITANKLSGFVKEMTVKLTASGFSIIKEMKDIEIPTSIESTTTYKTIKYVQ